MLTVRRAVFPLRILLALLFLVVTAGQIAILVVLLPRAGELVAGLLRPGWTMLAIAEADDSPGLGALHLLVLLVGAAVGLLMVVMRALLHQAADLRSDLEAVV